MLELICQQLYRLQGVPVDISPYRNHGSAIDAPGVPGPDATHEAIQFPNLDSRVAIGLGKLQAWSPLGALKIEIVARVDPQAALMLTLAEGDGSFLFYVNQTALAASIGGPSSAMYIRSADADAPDGKLHAVPTNKWTTLGFYHDGFAKMQLSIDGKIVGETTNVTGGVPSVQAGGVAIGNNVVGGRPLLGSVEEVSIWRLDPNEMRREFLCRPYDAATARCWEAIFRAVRAWVTSHPPQAKSLIDLIDARLTPLIRGLFLLPPAEQAKARVILQQYAKLWCEGRIDGSDMRDVLQQWIAELRRLGLDPAKNLPGAEIEALLSGIDVKLLTLDCDPAAIAFLQLMYKSFAHPGGKVS
jgi:hypothetical protein